VDRLRTDFALCVDDPLGNIMVHESVNQDIGILRHHLIKEIVVHLAFEGLVVAIINRLDKPRAAGGDELNLHAKDLDGIDNQSHLVNLKHIQYEDRDDAWQRHST
jgi:hypothetical protein